MFNIEENHEPQDSAVTTPIDPQTPASLPGERVEPELDSLSSENLPAASESAELDQRPNWAANFHANHLFFAQQWHKPYAEALLEDDPAKLPALIAIADQAILRRSIELHASAAATDERVDLRHAMDALAQLRTRTLSL